MARTVGGNASATTIFSNTVQDMGRTVSTEMAIRKTHPVPAATMMDSAGNANTIRRMRGSTLIAKRPNLSAQSPPNIPARAPKMPMKIGASMAIEDGNFKVTSAKVVMYVNKYWLTATPPMKTTV